jgi:hypothetical protein
MKNNKRNKPLGAVRTSDTNLGGWSAGTTGAQMTMTPQRGLGAKAVSDLDAVKARYARVKAAEHREAAREAAARCLAKREADAFAALDELLGR